MSRRTRAQNRAIRQAADESKTSENPVTFPTLRRAIRAQRNTLTPDEQGFPHPGQWVMLRYADALQRAGRSRVITSVEWKGTAEDPKGCECKAVVIDGGQPMLGTEQTFRRDELVLLLDPAGREFVRHELWAGEKVIGRK